MKKYIVKKVYQVVEISNGEWTIVDQFSSKEMAQNQVDVNNQEQADRAKLGVHAS